ncbi:alpha/beta hydrolase [Saccharopolyspora sp. K220]|uniref:alpha/beta fold hydrolase n=1 Tax=Saccharopolyspora soli TaxID=2926618 RepID=UPI001F583128|nr:alpha/beta hydrolase [Saccharopolyspora soli]MCI2423238.1 alpha/beta hydrolase [Saccharopolyspora soli]
MDGLPIVLVHGIRLSGQMWSEVVDLLSGSHRVIAADLPGHGHRRGERFTIDSAIGAVVDAVDELGGRALVAGMSLGGYAAIAAAARHPDRVAGLVAAGCTVRPGLLLAMSFRLAHRALSSLPDGGDALSSRMLRAAVPNSVAEPVLAGGIATEVIPDVLAAAADFDPVADLARYPGPTWLVNGRHDHFRAQEARFFGACRDGRLTIVPGAGHYLPMTHAAEFARLVLDAAACSPRLAAQRT